MKTLTTILYLLMKKNIRFYPNFSVIFSLALILSGIWIPGLVSTCYAQGPWTRKEAKFPTGRWELATCVVDGKIYAIGGAGPVYQALRTVEEYDPATDTWTTKSKMSTARQGLSTSVVNGKIYAIGGVAGSNSSYSFVETFSTVEEYDPVTDTWTTKSPMSTARGSHSANVLDGKIYVIGGTSASAPGGTAILAVEVYDPVTDTWTQKGNIPRRIGAGFTSVVDGKMYAFGGYGGLEKVHEYDPVTDVWLTKSDMPTARCALSTSVLDGKIYAIGGHSGSSPDLALATVEIYDPGTNIWTTTTDMLTGRAGVRTSVVNGKIYAIGGYMGTWLSAMCVTVEEYDPHLDLSILVEKTSLNKSYAKPVTDSVLITTKINDPAGISLMAEIEAPDQNPIDSLLLYDDGNHNDGNAGDSLYGNIWTVSSAEERNYYLDLEVIRIDADTLIRHLNNMAFFTTIGPVTFEDYTFAPIDTEPNPGDQIYLELTLRNNSATATATNIRAKLISLNTSVTASVNSLRFGDIVAGENATSNGMWTINISEECPVNTEVPIIVNISIYDHICWSDTFSIFIEPPVNIKNITEPITRIYPNPTDNILNIEISNADKQRIEIEILDIAGKVIYQKEYKNINADFSEQIDLSGYAKGIYLLKVRQANAIYFGKVVVR